MLPLLGWARCVRRAAAATAAATVRYRPLSTAAIPVRPPAHPHTLAQHADHLFCDVSSFGEVVPPISVTTTYHADSTRLDSEGFIYSRDGSPTVRKAEALVGQLEGPDAHALLFASGQAATFSALAYYRPRRVFLSGGYHGTHHAVDLLMGLGVVEEKLLLPADLRAHDFRDGDLVWLETPRNPTCDIADVAAARAAVDASGADAKVVVDATFAPPPLQYCLRLGAHAVMHSSTKYYAGHSDAMGGLLVVPDAEEKEQLRLQRTIMGNQPGSLEAWLLIRSCRTLSLRVERQCETAAKLARWLEQHPCVERVLHPSLESHPQHEVAKRQMPGGFGAVMNVSLRTEAQVQSLLSRPKYWFYATSLGGTESLIDWRHQYDESISPRDVRLSVGLEDFDDLAADLDEAIRAATAAN